MVSKKARDTLPFTVSSLYPVENDLSVRPKQLSWCIPETKN
ncbi:TEL1S.1 [Arabidopsis thaliana]|uniref:TEL1S.1 n=2 Tax=Arabidopsis thaliana TaxID=3702 RepID=Q9LM12_ARATH|nr:TEL1S.1 [Arabidopsis thaliana]